MGDRLGTPSQQALPPSFGHLPSQAKRIQKHTPQNKVPCVFLSFCRIPHAPQEWSDSHAKIEIPLTLDNPVTRARAFSPQRQGERRPPGRETPGAKPDALWSECPMLPCTPHPKSNALLLHWRGSHRAMERTPRSGRASDSSNGGGSPFTPLSWKSQARHVPTPTLLKQRS